MGKNVEAGAKIIAKIKDGVGGSGRGQISTGCLITDPSKVEAFYAHLG